MKAFLQAYRDELLKAIDAVDPDAFAGAVRLLADTYRADRQIFVIGNGGSAATANHFVCDFGKNAVKPPKRRFRILSACDNIEVITALGNDIAFDEIFRQQLINLWRPGDLLIAISASGNSPDLVHACELAREIGGKIIALAGFGGGKIASLADAALVTAMTSYERVEDLHLMLLHMFVCYFKENAEALDA